MEEAETKKSFELSGITVTIIAAVFGLLGTATGAALQGYFNQELENKRFDAESKLARQKFESDLILNAIATGNREQARNNLIFLVEAGLIEDSQGRISALTQQETKSLPYLPVSPEQQGGAVR
jgi:hypothetical protein